jgi:hypothetical protein
VKFIVQRKILRRGRRGGGYEWVAVSEHASRQEAIEARAEQPTNSGLRIVPFGLTITKRVATVEGRGIWIDANVALDGKLYSVKGIVYPPHGVVAHHVTLVTNDQDSSRQSSQTTKRQIEALLAKEFELKTMAVSEDDL